LDEPIPDVYSDANTSPEVHYELKRLALGGEFIDRTVMPPAVESRQDR
jgi:hypothetical protein